MLIPNDAPVEHVNCGQTPMLARPQQIVPSSWPHDVLDDLGLRCGKGRFPAEPQLDQAPVAETVPRSRFRHIPAQGEIKLSPAMLSLAWASWKALPPFV